MEKQIHTNEDSEFAEYQEADWQSIGINPSLMGQMNQQLRAKIAASHNDSMPLQEQKKHRVSTDAVYSMLNDTLDKAILEQKVETLYQEYLKVYKQLSLDKRISKRQFIGQTGLVMSPDQCITTLRDSLRIRSFVRGIDKAISRHFKNGKQMLSIVYPACGPFAPLLLPLLTFYKETDLYSAEQLQITLIDLQEGAIASLNSLIRKFELEHYIKDVICMDALEYQSKNPIDIVVLEAMQHGFTREGHLVIAKHYVHQMAHDGFFVPQKLTVQAVLNVAQREYVDQWMKDKSSEELKVIAEQVKSERTNVGEILLLTADTLRSMEIQELDEHTRMLECATLTIPELHSNFDKQVLSISSHIETFEGEILDEYESGITHPLPDLDICVNFIPSDSRPGDLIVKSGDKIQFYYCINGLPGFVPTKVQEL